MCVCVCVCVCARACGIEVRSSSQSQVGTQKVPMTHLLQAVLTRHGLHNVSDHQRPPPTYKKTERQFHFKLIVTEKNHPQTSDFRLPTSEREIKLLLVIYYDRKQKDGWTFLQTLNGLDWLVYQQRSAIIFCMATLCNQSIPSKSTVMLMSCHDQ